ncbi:MAG: YbjQ family protein [Candidatus Hodarchaeales archaeon]
MAQVRTSDESQIAQVMVSTTGEIPGFEIVQYLGVAFGITVRSRGAGGQCIGGCQVCFGGEISAYTQNSLEARNDAIYRLIQDVHSRGGNGVIGVRFDSSRSGRGGEMMDIVAYGTAVFVRPK